MLDKWKEYKEIIPILTLVLYVVGFIYYISYYLSFEIDITPHITLTEILICSIIGMAVFCIVIIPLEYILQKILSLIYKQKNTLSFLISLLLHFIPYCIFLFIAVENNDVSMLGICVLINFMWVYFTIAFVTRHKFNLKITPKVCLSMGIIIGVMSISTLGRMSAYFVINDKQKYKIEIVANEESYSTLNDENLYYIGETNSVYFLYNKKEESSIILDKRKVNKVIISKQTKGTKI